MALILIMARSRNGIIGKGDKLPWKQKADLQRFKKLTEGKIVVMGRKTWDGLPPQFRPLPNRANWILSRSQIPYLPEGAWQPFYPGQVIEAAQDTDVYVIGGREIFDRYIEYATKIELTVIEADVEGDVHYDLTLNRKDWVQNESQSFKADKDNDHDYSFVTLQTRGWKSS